MIKKKARLVFALLGSLALVVPLLTGQHKVRTENGVTVITNGRKPSPPQGAPTAGELSSGQPARGAMDAVTRGTLDGLTLEK